MNNGTLAYIFNTNFLYNSASNGSAIYADNYNATNNYIEIKVSTFAYNITTNGSTIRPNIDVVLADTKFIQNVATRAILDAPVNFSMDNVLFQGNIVTDNQKIGLTGDASMTIRNSDFIGNYANRVNRPGALRTTSNKTVSLIEM